MNLGACNGGFDSEEGWQWAETCAVAATVRG